jgi:hypothetical protein
MHGAHQKIKLALDETRILILGAQILLGFQFLAVFSDSYEEFPAGLRYLDGVAILPMMCVVALLITPGPYHRIVQNGEDSRSFHRLVTTIANLALAPFAIALGLDVVVTFGHLFGEVSGVFAGITAAAVAIGFWYGIPLVKRRHNCNGNSPSREISCYASGCKNRANADRNARHSPRGSGIVRLPARDCFHAILR